MYQPVDGPVIYASVSVGTTAVELKVGGSAQQDRKMMLIQSQGNHIYIGTDSSVTTANGIKLAKDQIIPIEAGTMVQIFAIASSGTIDVRIWEMS
jgi:hypothetical protein